MPKHADPTKAHKQYWCAILFGGPRGHGHCPVYGCAMASKRFGDHHDENPEGMWDLACVALAAGLEGCSTVQCNGN